MDGAQIIKKGTLESTHGSKHRSDQKPDWQKRYYVLFSSTDTNKARLDWFNDEFAFKSSPTIRKTIFIEEIKSISPCNPEGKNHGFQLQTLRRSEPFLFSAPNRHERKEWIDHLKRAVDRRSKEMPTKQVKGGEEDLGEGVYGNQLWGIDEIPIEFDVTVGETPSAEHCGLNKKQRTLQLFVQCMALVDKNDGDRILFVWPYKFIRRFGRSKNSFTFEAGRRCATGEGVFILLTNHAEELFNSVQKANTNQDQPQPSLPTRSYGDHYGEIAKAANKNHYSTEKKMAHSPNSPECRARSLSSGSRELPPIPAIGQGPSRPVQPLPPKPGGSTFMEVQENYSNPELINTDLYSCVTAPAGVAAAGDYGYAEPVEGDASSMSAAIASLKMSNKKARAVAEQEDEYDSVKINAMQRDVGGVVDNSQDQYGKLYAVNAKKAPAVNKASDDDLYQDVQG